MHLQEQPTMRRRRGHYQSARAHKRPEYRQQLSGAGRATLPLVYSGTSPPALSPCAGQQAAAHRPRTRVCRSCIHGSSATAAATAPACPPLHACALKPPAGCNQHVRISWMPFRALTCLVVLKYEQLDVTMVLRIKKRKKLKMAAAVLGHIKRGMPPRLSCHAPESVCQSHGLES
jgi:hypothetical protein